MKKVLIYIFFLSSIFLITSYALQEYTLEQLQDEWNQKIITEYSHNVFERVISTGDGYIAFGYAANHIAERAKMLVVKFDKNGNVIWNKTYGREFCYGTSIVAADDGYFLVGYQKNEDWRVAAIKIDKSGNEMWNATYSITGNDLAIDAVRAENGYLIGGWPVNRWPKQVFILKIDEDGNEIWHKMYGGTNDETLEQLIKVNEGYVFTGYTSSYGNGEWDAWLVKIDENGNEIWNRTYGGSNTDEARCVAATEDGGFIIAGATMSYGNGGDDNFIVKTDADGNMEWTSTFGGENFDESEAIVETDDGYAIAGYTSSFGVGDFDGLLLKIDKEGNIKWYKTFGGNNGDGFYDILEDNGSFVIAGCTRISSNPVKEAAWLIKCKDTLPPEMKIIRPEDGIYINDKKIISFYKTVAIGKITFEVDINQSIDEIEVYLDGKLNETLYYPPYNWQLNAKGIGEHRIKFVAYYGNAGANIAVEKNVYLINLFPISISASTSSNSIYLSKN
jgi:hypothetical protein